MNKTLLVGAGLGLVGAVVTMAPSVALADYHSGYFGYDSNGGFSIQNSGNLTENGTADITVKVKQNSSYNSNGDEKLPSTIQFTFKEGNTIKTVSGTLITNKNNDWQHSSQQDQVYTGTYAVNLPQNFSGDCTISTTGFNMWSKHGSSGWQEDSYGGKVGGDSGGCHIDPGPPHGNLPEIPYAGIIPVLLAGGYFGYRYMKKTRKAH